MSQDESLIKVTIPALSLDVPYQNWRLSIESALMTKGLIKYIQTALPPDAPTADFDKRTQAFGIILAHLSFSERLAIEHILTLGTHDAYALWNDIKYRYEKVTISRVWAYWKRLNAHQMQTTRLSTNTTADRKSCETAPDSAQAR